MDNEDFLAATLGSMDHVYNLARRLTTTRQDAEDLVQETYLAALKAWQAHRRPRRVDPWLVTICLNLARSGHRRWARRPREVPWEEADGGALADGTTDSSDEAMVELERASVHQALRRLSDEQRIAITLVDLIGFSVRDAARALRVPKGTVLSRLHRGRKTLATLLSRNVEERT